MLPIRSSDCASSFAPQSRLRALAHSKIELSELEENSKVIASAAAMFEKQWHRAD